MIKNFFKKSTNFVLYFICISLHVFANSHIIFHSFSQNQLRQKNYFFSKILKENY